MPATTYAAIESSTPTGTVYGLGRTQEAAIRDAMRHAGVTVDCDGVEIGGRDSYRAVPCTPAAARYIRQHGGAPSARLSVPRSECGRVELISEEE